MTCVNRITLLPKGLLCLLTSLKYKEKEALTLKEEYRSQYEKFGLNIVYYRKRKRLTQLQLAELIDVDRSHISALELGKVGISLDVIFKMCEVLEITPKELFDFRE